MSSTHHDTQHASARRVHRANGGVSRGHKQARRGRDRDGLVPRFRVSLHQRRLDRELAAGLPVAGSPERELRAAQLVERPSRAMLARTLRRLVADARARREGLSPLVAPAEGAVLPCETAMLELAERIDGDAPVEVAGLARTRVMLTDGCGPLYDRRADLTLAAELLAIGEALGSR